MGIEFSSDSAVCFRCGKKFGRRKGSFSVSYATMHKGVGYIPWCKECVDKMYKAYLDQLNDPKAAVRQMCRKMDLYWSDDVYDLAMRKTSDRSVMTQYITKINTITYAGKSYDDTLIEENALWNFNTDVRRYVGKDDAAPKADRASGDKPEGYVAPPEVVEFWGSGYTQEMYRELDNRFKYWTSNLPEGFEMDIGTEAIIKQICSLELDINRDRAAGRAVDKSIAALNTLLGSANLKPNQKKDDSDASLESPLGVWIRRFETQRPIPEPDPEFKDVDGIIKYISTWLYGHMCKMLNIKGIYCKLYEDEMAKMRVDRPEYDDEDDEAMFNDIFTDASDDDGEHE